MILDGHREFPAMTNGEYVGSLLNRDIDFIHWGEAGDGDCDGLLIDALVHRPKFDAESEREPDIHYWTHGIALRLCLKRQFATVGFHDVGERHAGLDPNRDALRECARCSRQQKTGHCGSSAKG